MKSLQSLDLSMNNISGEILPSLSETFLSTLDLSYNDLVGRIPQGDQLDTLYPNNPSMYDGNSGFVIGLWVVFCAILFKRSWRVAYFRQLDKFYDITHVFAVVTWGRLTRHATACKFSRVRIYCKKK
uniref:Leucine-rich repeat-containing N-terminal plant-type domain-containing protein n=1 Tax=Leersia perrieri TaxID=77586 RepID=A0A0D9XT94_9ORYZ